MSEDKNFLSLFTKGIAIGCGNAVAGISGGTIAYITGIYGDMIYSLANLTKDFKKHIWFLFKVFLGVGVGLLGAMKLFQIVFPVILLEMVSLFAGVIIGGIYNDRKDYHIKEGTKKTKYIIGFIIAFVIVISMSLVNYFMFPKEAVESAKLDVNNKWENVTLSQSLLLFVMMTIGASCMIFPGISGSLCFMILGIYYPVLQRLMDLMKFELYSDPLFVKDTLMMMIPLILGCLVSFIFVSKPINLLYQKHKDIFDYVVLGFLCASIISMYILNYNDIVKQFSWYHPLLAFIIFLPGGFIIARLLHKEKRRLENT